ncbi:MAG TPA: hypothetical protein VIF60_19395 [Burkholderiaceae bacterium]|jgi:hypothetical protein
MAGGDRRFVMEDAMQLDRARIDDWFQRIEGERQRAGDVFAGSIGKFINDEGAFLGLGLLELGSEQSCAGDRGRLQ